VDGAVRADPEGAVSEHHDLSRAPARVDLLTASGLRAAATLGWLAMVAGAFLGVGALYYSVASLSVGSAAFTAIVLFIGGVIAATLVVSGLRLRRGSGPAGPRGPLGSHDRSKTEGGRCHRLVGDGQSHAEQHAWSIYNAATRPKPNELDVIDLLLGLAIAVTLVAVSMRFRQHRSPWRSFLVGFALSLGLFVQALRVAFRTFN